MQGNTNSIIGLASGSSSYTVYANNNTGGEINADDKIWLNRHNNPSVTGSYYHSNSASDYLAHIFIANTLYKVQVGNLIRYNFSNGEFSQTNIETGLAEVYMPYFVGTQALFRNISTNLNSATTNRDVLINPDGISRNIPGYYLGNNMYLKYGGSTRHYNIVEYDVATGTEGSVLGSIVTTQDNLFNAFVEGTLLVLQVRGTTRPFMEYYDISDLSSITRLFAKDAPSTYMYLTYVTGFNVGDYLFFETEVNNYGDLYYGSSSANPPTLRIYQLGTNFDYEAPTNLPPELAALNNNPAVVRYDSRTKYLTVGTHDNVYFFKFDTTTRTFSQIILDITLPTESAINDKYCYVAALSGDLTTVAITYKRSSSSYVYPAYKLYKLSNASDTEWYAEPYQNFNANTITGVATGNVKDGKYEVKTIHPVVDSDNSGNGGYF